MDYRRLTILIRNCPPDSLLISPFGPCRAMVTALVKFGQSATRTTSFIWLFAYPSVLLDKTVKVDSRVKASRCVHDLLTVAAGNIQQPIRT
jgi:hypothetical protein